MCATETEAGWSEAAEDNIEAEGGPGRCTGDHRGPPSQCRGAASDACDPCWGSPEAWAAPGEEGWRNEARGNEAASCQDQEI